jgi:3-mercaptopyruvate sulfurtransferase SseA
MKVKIHYFTPKFLLLLLFSFILIQVSKSHALEVPRITLEELKSKLEQKADVIVADARGKDSFEQEHIKGAISMPLGEVEERHKELPKDKEIVFY